MRVAMLYPWDWSHEFRDYEAGLVPAHRLMGAAELPELGFQVTICRWGPVPAFLRRGVAWKLWQALWVARTQRSVDCVVAISEAAALPTLSLRRFGLLRRRVVVLAPGAMSDSYVHGPGARLRRYLLRRASRVVVYSSALVPLVAGLLGVPRERVRFIPFGVDVDFFPPTETDPEPEWDVVAAGTNEGKDYPTLVSALSPGSRCLIVTDELNARLALGTPTEGALTVRRDVPIHELRRLYASARCLVIPLRDVPFASGLTILLENLAMGRPMIVSDTAATRDYVPAAVARVVPASDIDAMRMALQGSHKSIVPAAATHVREHFSSAHFATTLAALCREVIRSG